jgi:hypothetical protein
MTSNERIKIAIGGLLCDAIAAERAGQKDAATLISGSAFQLAHATVAAATSAPGALNNMSVPTPAFTPDLSVMTLDEVLDALREDLPKLDATTNGQAACLAALEAISKKKYAVAGGHLVYRWATPQAIELANACQRALNALDNTQKSVS